MIVPITGGLIMIGAFVAFLEDVALLRRNEFKPKGVIKGGA
jgi:hypothetical protein